MALEVKKQERESTQSLVRRFTKSVQQSGLLIKARKNRFFRRPASSRVKKIAALRKIEMAKARKKLQKLGRK